MANTSRDSAGKVPPWPGGSAQMDTCPVEERLGKLASGAQLQPVAPCRNP